MNFEYPSKLRFQCIKCAICCGDTSQKTRHILLLNTEAQQIAETSAQPITNFAQKTNKIPYTYEMKKTAKDGKCIFLKNNRCTIYPQRPLICRFYPFQLTTTPNGKHQFHFTMECPGINKGKPLPEAYFRKMLRLAREKHRQNANPNQSEASGKAV